MACPFHQYKSVSYTHLDVYKRQPQTPLQQKLKQTGKVLGAGVLVICAVIFGLGLIQKIEPLDMFMIAISLGAVSYTHLNL